MFTQVRFERFQFLSIEYGLNSNDIVVLSKKERRAISSSNLERLSTQRNHQYCERKVHSAASIASTLRLSPNEETVF